MKSHFPTPFPKRSLGQNYLVDTHFQDRIQQAFAEHYEGETTLEIGPGPGAITQGLVRVAKNLILIEKDRRQVEFLNEKFAAEKNLQIHNADFLEIDFATFPSPFFAVGNLPYNVASPILIRILENHALFHKMLFMFQREVAERIVAKPREDSYSVISVWARLCTQAQILFDVPPNAFRPRPKVTSSVVYFEMRKDIPEDLIDFMKFVRRLFMTRRKKIATTLKQQFNFDVRKKNLSEEILSLAEKRPEELDVGDFRKIYSTHLLQ